MTKGRVGIARVLPEWPGRRDPEVRRRAQAGGVFGSMSYRHAERAWEEARSEGYLAWLRSGRRVETSQALDLVFLGALGSHVASCSRCGRVSRADGSERLGVVEDTPSEWLRWAVWSVRRFRDVAAAVQLPPRRGGTPVATVVREWDPLAAEAARQQSMVEWAAAFSRAGA